MKIFFYSMIPILLFCLIVFFDMIFFRVNKTFLNKTIHSVQNRTLTLKYPGALLCYLALTLILYNAMKLNYTQTFGLGVGIYAVYEGTNYAIFDHWPLKMVVLDTLWGGILFVLVKWTNTFLTGKLKTLF